MCTFCLLHHACSSHSLRGLVSRTDSRTRWRGECSGVQVRGRSEVSDSSQRRGGQQCVLAQYCYDSTNQCSSLMSMLRSSAADVRRIDIDRCVSSPPSPRSAATVNRHLSLSAALLRTLSGYDAKR